MGTGRFLVSSGFPRGLEQMCKLPFLTHGLISNALDSESSKETTLCPGGWCCSSFGVTGTLSALRNDVLGWHSSWTPDSLQAGQAGTIRSTGAASAP